MSAAAGGSAGNVGHGVEFLLVGAGRSGTTGLIEGLRRHPGVFITQPKEPHYFAFHGSRPDFRGPGDDRLLNSRAITDWDAYRALYAEAEPGDVRGEASVSSLYYHQRAIPEIQRRIADPRIVIVLREPVARAYSAFEYHAGQDLETVSSFEEALAAEDSRVQQGWQHLWHYRRMSLYHDAVAAYLDAFGRDRVRVWFYDDVQRDYNGTVSEVLGFVGAPDPTYTGPNVVVNSGGKARHELVGTLINRGRTSSTLRTLVRATTSYRVRDRVRQALMVRGSAGTEQYADLAPEFADDLGALRQQLAGQPLPSWLADR